MKCRNIIIGDIKNAKVVLSAHYDTCSALPFPNFITPKKPLFTIRYSLLIIIPISALVLVLNKLLINFDCVSDDDHILLAATKATRDTYGEQFEISFRSNDNKTVLLDNLEKIYYPSGHAGFHAALAAAALKKKPIIGYYMDRIHTLRDTEFGEANITLLCNGVRGFLEKI